MNCQSRINQARINQAGDTCKNPASHFFLVQRKDGLRKLYPKVPYLLAWCSECCDGTMSMDGYGPDSPYRCYKLTPDEVEVFQVMEA